MPGYGAQGGNAADIAAAFRADGLGAIVNSSRGIIFAFSRTRTASGRAKSKPPRSGPSPTSRRDADGPARTIRPVLARRQWLAGPLQYSRPTRSHAPRGNASPAAPRRVRNRRRSAVAGLCEAGRGRRPRLQKLRHDMRRSLDAERPDVRSHAERGNEVGFLPPSPRIQATDGPRLLRSARGFQEGVPRRDQEGLPQAGPAVPPGPQPRRQAGRVQLQGSAGGLRRPQRQDQAEQLRPLRLRRRVAEGSAAVAGGRTGRCHFHWGGGVRRPGVGPRRRCQHVPPVRRRRRQAEDDLGGPGGGLGRRDGGRRACGRPPPPRKTAETRFSIPFQTAALGGAVPLQSDGREIAVKVPAGVEDGKCSGLPGQAPGGGDLHRQAERRAAPVLPPRGQRPPPEVPVSLPEAVLGAKVEVPTLDGDAADGQGAGGHVERQPAAAARQGDRGRGTSTSKSRSVVPVAEGRARPVN